MYHTYACMVSRLIVLVLILESAQATSYLGILPWLAAHFDLHIPLSIPIRNKIATKTHNNVCDNCFVSPIIL